MTEQNAKNKEIYLNLCEKIWDFDEESLAYVNKRLSDEWEPVKEFKDFIDKSVTDGKATYEDQRLRFKMDTRDPKIQSFFEANDESYKLFRSYFGFALTKLRQLGVTVSYSEFISNKVVFHKNVTKIKKVLENIYASYDGIFQRDAGQPYSKESCASFIVKNFERIGSSKKSAKELEMVISFNPMDWLLSSTSEHFSSCFNLNNPSGGFQFCLGLPFLCGDNNRMMIYLTDGRRKEFEGINVEGVITRTWCILDESGSFNIVKWYPNDTVGVNPVNEITGYSNFKNKDSFKKSKYSLDVLASKLGAYYGVYLDMGKLTVIDDKLYIVGNTKEGQQRFSKNLVECDNKTTSFTNPNHEIHGLHMPGVGYCIPKWRECGFHFDKMFSTLRCPVCGEDKAGVRIENGDSEYKYICFDCYKKMYSTCGSCGNSYIRDPKKCKKVMTKHGEIELCPSCSRPENIKAHTCSICGMYHPGVSNLEQLPNGDMVCPECARKEGYVKCPECGKLSKSVICIYDSFSGESRRMCDSCLDSSSKNMFREVFLFGKYFPVIRKKAKNGLDI